MVLTLDQILSLVGTLDDTPGANTPRERFRRFVQENVTEVGQIRDYVEACLRASGPPYSRALQDLVNHLGHFLGFEVTYGRYHGVPGEIGFDGLWKSETGFHVVVEVKTTEVYAIKTATLLNYINELVSTKVIPDPDKAFGLYVVGRPDPELRSLENAIIGERKTDQLRIISVDSLLSLAEMTKEYEIAHDDVLAIIRPFGPNVDPVVDLMARLVAQPRSSAEVTAQPSSEVPMRGPGEATEIRPVASSDALRSEVGYWIAPVRSIPDESAKACIARLVGKEHIFAIGENTPGRKRIQPGDWIAFYANGVGVVAHAKVASPAEHKPVEIVRGLHKYPWVFRLINVKTYLDHPVVIDRALRSRLEAFRGRNPDGTWAWFVQVMRPVSKHDFGLLTGQETSGTGWRD